MGSSVIQLEEIFRAYFDCRRNKRNTSNALAFEVDYENQLIQLHQEIITKQYSPGRSIAFIVDKPVVREIFAADFRDRIVHHLLINKLNQYFEKEFINDNYACRIGKGTHFGIKRADQFIRQCSKNYTQDCYILKLDLKSFFMTINKNILWSRLLQFIQDRYYNNDKDLVLYLCKTILDNDPTQNCLIKGNRKKWYQLPKDKSLFYSEKDCGLAIGNLTSQIFANFYMNSFDHYIKSYLKIRYYGRFVDDFFLIHEDQALLKQLIPEIEIFLKTNLGLILHPKKRYLQHYSHGTNFLGVHIRPNCITVGKRIKGNFYHKIIQHNEKIGRCKPNNELKNSFISSINSYLGIMKHYKTFVFRKKIISKYLSAYWNNVVYFTKGYNKTASRIKKPRNIKLF